MIFNKPKSTLVGEDDGDMSDLPPSYQAAVATGGPAASSSSTSDAKPSPPPSTSSRNTAITPRLRPFTTKAKPRSSFFSKLFGPAGTARQVKEATQSLIRDLVQKRAPDADTTGSHPLSPGATQNVLDSCAAACAAQGLSLADILCEPFIEGHTPVYWAVLVQDADYTKRDDKLVNLLLSYALVPTRSPQSVASEVRAACTLASDDALWRQLKRCFPPLEHPLPGPESMILSNASGVARDDVLVTTRPSEDGAFSLSVRMPLFQKRMRVVGTVGVEFIAGGRLFRLDFFVNANKGRRDYNHNEGIWLVALTLLPPSAPTKIYGRVIIPPADTSIPASKAGIPALDKKSRTAPVVVKLSAREELRADASYCDAREIRRPLAEGVLQHEGSPYIDKTGMLTYTLEAQFTLPSLDKADCIIC